MRREGVSFDVIGKEVSDADTILVVPEGIGDAEAELARNHLFNGGSLVADARASVMVWPQLSHEKERRLMLASGRALFIGKDGRELGWLSAYRPHAETVGENGCCSLVLPFDLSAQLSQTKSVDRAFAAMMPRQPFETVSVVDRGAVRRLIANCLRSIVWSRCRPYVHLSYNPPGLSPGFGFRLDVDSASPEQLERSVSLARSRGMRFTWFIDTGVSFDLESLRDLLDGQDVQLHCSVHRTFRDRRRNRANFECGRRALMALGVSPSGVAAPYGEWSPSLSDVLGQIGFRYSSEFCYAYDDLPGYPQASGTRPVLQVPVHPISIGRLAWARATSEQMVLYYKSVIDFHRARLEPCFLYDHPDTVGRYSEVVAQVLDYGLKMCGGELNITDYADWWRRRDELRVRVVVRSNTVEVTGVEGDPGDMALTIEWPERYATRSLQMGAFLLNSLSCEVRPDCPAHNYGKMSRAEESLLFHLRALRRRALRRLKACCG